MSGCRGRAISAPSAASWRISANQLHALECGGCASPSTQTQRENTYRADVDNGVQELGQGLGQITVHIICKHNIHSPWRKQSKQKNARAHTHRQTQTNTSELPHNNALEQDATCKSQHSHVGVERKRHSKAADCSCLQSYLPRASAIFTLSRYQKTNTFCRGRL